jgi:hypothetical protein
MPVGRNRISCVIVSQHFINDRILHDEDTRHRHLRDTFVACELAGHSIAGISFGLSNLEPRWACGRRGAEVRPDIDWDKWDKPAVRTRGTVASWTGLKKFKLSVIGSGGENATH